MNKPNIEGLRRVAVFQVGDVIYLDTGRPWKVTARYWSARKQSIVYDLLFEYNGLTLDRVEEHRMSREDVYRPLGWKRDHGSGNPR